MIEVIVAGLVTGSVWAALRVPVPHRSRAALRLMDARVLRKRGGIVSGAITELGRHLPGASRRIEGLLRASGSARSAEYVSGLRVCLAGVGILIGLLLGVAPWLLAPVLGAFGYRGPVVILQRRVSARREALRAQLPEAVDMLAVCTQAGLNVPLAIKRVSDKLSGPLGEELSSTLASIDLGVPRAEALMSLSDRVGIDEVEAIVTTLVSADRFGTQVADALALHADELSQSRRRVAEERARKAPVKMLFPLVFLILPGFVLLTLVPLLLSTFASLGF